MSSLPLPPHAVQVETLRPKAARTMKNPRPLHAWQFG